MKKVWPGEPTATAGEPRHTDKRLSCSTLHTLITATCHPDRFKFWGRHVVPSCRDRLPTAPSPNLEPVHRIPHKKHPDVHSNTRVRTYSTPNPAVSPHFAPCSYALLSAPCIRQLPQPPLPALPIKSIPEIDRDRPRGIPDGSGGTGPEDRGRRDVVSAPLAHLEPCTLHLAPDKKSHLETSPLLMILFRTVINGKR